MLCCKELIVSYPQVSSSKSIDNILWKHTFYRTIEGLRKRIRNLSSILEKSYNRTNSTDIQYQENQHQLLRMSSSLNQFLSQTAAFYEGFLMQLEVLIEKKLHEKESTNDLHQQSALSLDVDGYLKSFYFCLLYLGDIARYTELHSSSNKQKNWGAASQYYLRARQVLPQLGNSHNQLAVLCSYKATQSAIPPNMTPGLLVPPNPSIPVLSNASIELNAIYHYCRSILVETPFQTGIENLKLMFEKSAKRFTGSQQATFHQADPRGHQPYQEYDRRLTPAFPQHPQSYYYPGTSHYSSPHLQQQSNHDSHQGKKNRSGDNQSNLPEFISLFLSIMSEIFALSLSEIALGTLLQTSQQEAALRGPDHSGSTLDLANHITEHGKLQARIASTISNSLPNLLEEFEVLFSDLTSQLSGEVLLRMLTVSIFAIHFTRHELQRKLKSLNIENHLNLLSNFLDQRFHSESYGITCLFSLISRLALKICPISTTSVDKTRRRLLLRVVQFLNVFCDWGRMNPHYLHSVHSTLSQTESDHSNFTSGVEVLKASGELLRGENRVRSSLRATVSDLKSFLNKLSQSHGADEGSKFRPKENTHQEFPGHLFGNLSLPLPEYIELRGYLPLADYEIFFRGVSLKTMISVSFPSEKESASITRRLQNIEEFIEFSLVPPPPPPVIPQSEPPTSSEIKRRQREDRKSTKDRKKEKKSRRQMKDDQSKEKRKKPEKAEMIPSKENDFLPNDEDFPDIRKYNEVSPQKTSSTSIYAAALAAVQVSNNESLRQRTLHQDDEDFDESEEEEDDDSDVEEDSSQESSNSENETSLVEIGSKENPEQKLTSANLHDDFDEDDEIIVFKPIFSQFSTNPIGPPPASSVNDSIPSPVHLAVERQSDDRVVHQEDKTLGGIDLDSFAYLQALHQKNTSKNGWISQPESTTFQSSSAPEFVENSNSNPFQGNSQRPFQLDYWGPESNFGSSIFAGLEHGTKLDHARLPQPNISSNLPNETSSWSQRQSSTYNQFSPSHHVPPPPGFSSDDHSEFNPQNYQMNPDARSFLPTSLREPSQAPQRTLPNQSEMSPSVLSMLYGDQDQGPPLSPHMSPNIPMSQYRGMNGNYYR